VQRDIRITMIGLKSYHAQIKKECISWVKILNLKEAKRYRFNYIEGFYNTKNIRTYVTTKLWIKAFEVLFLHKVVSKFDIIPLLNYFFPRVYVFYNRLLIYKFKYWLSLLKIDPMTQSYKTLRILNSILFKNVKGFLLGLLYLCFQTIQNKVLF
jgi:hypothetical protein